MGSEQRLYLSDAFGKRLTGEQEFHPVARGQENQFLDVSQVGEHVQRVGVVPACHGHLLSNFHRRRFMIRAYEGDVSHHILPGIIE